MKSGDVLTVVSVRGALEEDDPETWETHALGWAPKADEQGRPKLWAACAVGVGGQRSSDEAGERMTPDPVERKTPASDRTSRGNHG